MTPVSTPRNGGRWLLALACAVAACAHISSEPGDDEGGGRSAAKREACGEARDCRPDDAECETYTYENLPERCWVVCHQYCCAYASGKWQLRSYDCMPDGIDAGIDAWIPADSGPH